MCGIAGLVRRDVLTPGDVSAVTLMADAESHRGPDGSGVYNSRHAALGHRRLSIIDTSARGTQPMANEDGSIWLVYNGELYNHVELREELLAQGHRFRSLTDSEVIVHGYEQWGGDGLLERLRGMYAFGLYDARRGLLLGRDRLGIKPLYYYLDESAGVLLFASEVRALVRSGLVRDDRDPDALAGFLLGGSVPAPLTIVKGVRSLLPGHFLFWRDGHVSIRKYWDLDLEPQDRTEKLGTLDPEPAVVAIRDLLMDSVRRHLVSDVPLGVFLSGGVDSGSIVSLASRCQPAGSAPLTTLTVTFDEAEFDEADPSRKIAARYTTDHREVRVRQREFVEELPNIFAAIDQPTNDGVNTYFVSKAARQAGLTVVLSGLGGDEVFWGYPHYRQLGRRARWLARCPAPARRTLAWGAASWGAARGRDNWMRMSFLERRASSRELYLLMRGFFAPQHVMRLLDVNEREVARACERHFEGLGQLTVPSAATFNYLEHKRYLHDQLLRDGDVFSMAHSIEMRVPLLDAPLVEYAARLRPELKVPNGINKPLLVKAIDDPLLLEASTTSKRGFSFPMRQWMTDAADQLADVSRRGPLNRCAVGELWQQFRLGRLHWSRAWALSVLGATSHV